MSSKISAPRKRFCAGTPAVCIPRWTSGPATSAGAKSRTCPVEAVVKRRTSPCSPFGAPPNAQYAPAGETIFYLLSRPLPGGGHRETGAAGRPHWPMRERSEDRSWMHNHCPAGQSDRATQQSHSGPAGLSLISFHDTWRRCRVVRSRTTRHQSAVLLTTLP